jgi:hypothetical protein
MSWPRWDPRQSYRPNIPPAALRSDEPATWSIYHTHHRGVCAATEISRKPNLCSAGATTDESHGLDRLCRFGARGRTWLGLLARPARPGGPSCGTGGSPSLPGQRGMHVRERFVVAVAGRRVLTSLAGCAGRPYVSLLYWSMHGAMDLDNGVVCLFWRSRRPKFVWSLDWHQIDLVERQGPLIAWRVVGGILWFGDGHDHGLVRITNIVRVRDDRWSRWRVPCMYASF